MTGQSGLFRQRLPGLVALLLALAACGQTGPLFLPDESGAPPGAAAGSPPGNAAVPGSTGIAPEAAAADAAERDRDRDGADNGGPNDSGADSGSADTSPADTGNAADGRE